MHSPRGSNDEYTQLLLRAQRGDSQSFAALYTALRPIVRDFAASLDGQLSAYDLEDVVQEAFLRTWRGLADFRGDASAKTFIFAIARHVVLDELRRRRTARGMPASHTEQVAASSDDLADSSVKELTERVAQAIAGLTDTQRQAVELDQFPDLSRRQAARLAGCSPAQFAGRLHRARKRLKQMLNKWFHSVLP